jgi:hypothetical protein
MDASSAIMVLLMCSPVGTECMEIRSERTYESAQLCRDVLPVVLARMNKAGLKVSGTCAVAEDVPAGVDPIVTCSTGRQSEPATTTVGVTQIVEGKKISDEWVVPKRDQRRCG